MVLWLRIIILAALSYALGNWSMARMVAWNSQTSNRVSITAKGSGNPGTMNMVRSFGWKKGIGTLILDVIKGAVPALLGNLLLEYGLDGKAFNPSALGVYVGGLAVVIGHMFPIAFRFRGGKGVACGIGVFLVADPFLMLIVFVLGFLVFLIFEYGFVASLTCILAMAVLEIVQIYTGRFFPVMKNPDWDRITEVTKYVKTCVVLICVIFALIYAAHWKNFQRLFTGKETRLSMRNAFKKLREKRNGGDSETTDSDINTENNKENEIVK